MFHNKHVIAPQPIPFPELPPTDISVIGQGAVRYTDQFAHSLVQAGQTEEFADHGRRIARTKITPAEAGGAMSIKIGRWRGRVMSGYEVSLVSDIESLDELAGRQLKDAQEYGQIAEWEVKKVRADITNLSPVQQDQLDSYMRTTGNPFLKTVKAKSELIGNDSWANWLGVEATDDQVINFLQWHNHLLAEQRLDPNVEVEIDAQKQQYIDNVEQAIKDGWLSQTAHDIKYDVYATNVVIGDQFDTIMKGRDGYHDVNSGKVTIAQGMGGSHAERIESAKKEVQDTLPHELNHANLDATPQAKDAPMFERWIAEALAEQIDFAFRYGQPDIIDPLARKYANGVYGAERSLLHLLLNKGAVKIPTSQATIAYSGSDLERQTFFDALDESWGTAVLPQINERIRYWEKELTLGYPTEIACQNAALLSVTIELLHRPEAIFGTGYKAPTPAGEPGNRVAALVSRQTEEK